MSPVLSQCYQCFRSFRKDDTRISYARHTGHEINGQSLIVNVCDRCVSLWVDYTTKLPCFVRVSKEEYDCFLKYTHDMFWKPKRSRGRKHDTSTTHDPAITRRTEALAKRGRTRRDDAQNTP